MEGYFRWASIKICSVEKVQVEKKNRSRGEVWSELCSSFSKCKGLSSANLGDKKTAGQDGERLEKKLGKEWSRI